MGSRGHVSKDPTGVLRETLVEPGLPGCLSREKQPGKPGSTGSWEGVEEGGEYFVL